MQKLKPFEGTFRRLLQRKCLPELSNTQCLFAYNFKIFCKYWRRQKIHIQACDRSVFSIKNVCQSTLTPLCLHSWFLVFLSCPSSSFVASNQNCSTDATSPGCEPASMELKMKGRHLRLISGERTSGHQTETLQTSSKGSSRWCQKNTLCWTWINPP